MRFIKLFPKDASPSPGMEISYGKDTTSEHTTGGM